MRTAGITQWCMMIRVGMQVRQQVKLVHRRGKLVKVLMRPACTELVPYYPANNGAESDSGSVPNSLLQGDPNTRVYLGIIDGEPDYVGIAYDVERRQSQHGDRFDYLREITTEPLTRRQARAIEQAMIKNHPEYSNKINSISTKRDWYNDAVTWGKAWLREHGLLE